MTFFSTSIFAQIKYKVVDIETKNILNNVAIVTTDELVYYTNEDGEVLIPKNITNFTVISPLYEKQTINNSGEKGNVIELQPKVKEIAEVVITKKLSLYKIAQSVIENYDNIYYNTPAIYNANLMQKTYYDNKLNHLFIADTDIWEKNGSYKLGISGAMANPKNFVQLSFNKIKYFKTKITDGSFDNDMQPRTFNRLLFFNFNLAFVFKYTDENTYTSTYENIADDELLIKFKSGFLKKQQASIEGELIYNTKTKAITYIKWTANQDVTRKTKTNSEIHSSQFTSEFRVFLYQGKYIPSLLNYSAEGYITKENDIKKHNYLAKGIVQYGKLTPATDSGLKNSIDITKPLSDNISNKVVNSSNILLSKEEQEFINEQ